jgi:hypothetical protein
MKCEIARSIDQRDDMTKLRTISMEERDDFIIILPFPYPDLGYNKTTESAQIQPVTYFKRPYVLKF